jgi:quercetin dioxygenase-like cupin family protein
MTIRTIIGATSVALATATAMPAAAHDVGDIVTAAFQQAIPNIPGKTLTAVIVDYPPGGASPSHIHADSAFIFAYVIAGEIESKVNDGPTQVFRAGQSWHEPPASRHSVSRNASKTLPAKLLAVFVADSSETALTTPAN